MGGAGNTILHGVVDAGTDALVKDGAGTLTVTANSVLDLGSCTGQHTIQFAVSSAVSWTGGAILTITNWRGIAKESGGAGRMLFGPGGLTSTQLGQVYWSDQNIDGGFLLGSEGELTPIPEARVVFAMAVLAAFVVWRERRRMLGWLSRQRS